MGGKRLPVCRHCGGKFHPDVYNRHHQQWCDKPECRQARERARKRDWHRRRRQRDPAFQDAERERCREAMRRSRARQKARADEAPPVAVSAPVVTVSAPPIAVSAPPATELLVGLIAHLVDTSDLREVAQAMDRYAERGRRLAVAPPVRAAP